jgi:hypothetical protein
MTDKSRCSRFSTNSIAHSHLHEGEAPTIALKNKRPRHFPLTQPDVQFLFGLNASLTAAEWRMWLYLVTLDPFGDVGARYDAEALMNFCKIQKSTYFAAKAKFIKLGLFEFVEGTPKVRNLSGSKSERRSEIYKASSKVSEQRSEIVDFNSETSVRHSEISELQTLETLLTWDSGTPHTLSDIIQTLSDDFTKPTLHPQGEEIEKVDLEIQNSDLEHEIENFDPQSKDPDPEHQIKNLDPKIENLDLEHEIENFDLQNKDPDPEHQIKNLDPKIENLDLEHEIENFDLQNKDPDLETQEDKKQPAIKEQKKVTDRPLLPKQTGKDSFQVPPPPAAPEFSFLDWVKYYKAKDARSPLIYAQTCIRRDDGSLRAEYERWLAMRKDPVFSVYTPETVVLPPPEERPSIVANVREILRSRGLKL